MSEQPDDQNFRSEILLEIQEEFAVRGWSTEPIEVQVEVTDEGYRVELTKETDAGPVDVSKLFPEDTDPVSISREMSDALQDKEADG